NDDRQLWHAFGKTFYGNVEMYVDDFLTFELRTTSNINDAKRDCKSEFIRKFTIEDIMCSDITFNPKAIKKKETHLNAACFDLYFTFKHAEPIIDLIQPNNTVIGFDDPFNISVNRNSRDFSSAS